jgi:adenine-specific DNA-methyltransferase
MKNRLEVARELLSDDGVIYISIDHHENHTIKQICMEIFSESNFVQEIIVKTSTPTGFKIVNPGPVKITEQIIIFAKNKPKYLETENELFVPDKYDPEYSNFIINYEEDYTKWKIGKLKEIVIKEIGTEKMNKLKEEDKELYEYLLQREMPRLAIEYADRLFSTKKPHKPAPVLKEVMEKSKAQPDRFLRYKKQDGSYYYLLNGRLLAFYSSKLKKINNSLVPAKHLTNLWDDISWSAVDKESGVKLPNGKKPEKLLERIITLSTKPGDIVLDFFMGTGTTCAVAHKMGRQYIGIEQLDYGENDSVVRLQDVINGDQSGISKSVNWQGGGDFIYFELAKWNETAKEIILESESLEELEKFFDEMYERYFLNYNLKIKEFKEKVLKEENFRNLSLDEQKKIFIAMLDNNQMYVNKTEMADKKFGISEEDKNLTNQFYNEER